MKYLLLALALTACGITEIERALDNSPPEPRKIIRIRRCAQDSAQAADTAQFIWCGPSSPAPVATFRNGGEP